MFPIIQKKTEGTEPKEIHAALAASLGGRFLDRGSFARVYVVSPKQVVKIGQVRGNESYLRFVSALSKAKKHNPYFPKIAKVEFYNGLVFAVFMEKLTPTGKGSYTGGVGAELAEDIERTIRYAESTPNVALWSAAKLLRNVQKSHWSFQLDLHPYNLMLRGKQPVIIDPLANIAY